MFFVILKTSVISILCTLKNSLSESVISISISLYSVSIFDNVYPKFLFIKNFLRRSSSSSIKLLSLVKLPIFMNFYLL